MSPFLKKGLFIGYYLVVLTALLFRDSSMTIPRYFFMVLVIVIGASIIARTTSKKPLMYYIPIGLSLIMAIIFSILGLTQYNDQFTGGVVLIIGLSLLFVSIAGFLLQKPFTKYLFEPQTTQQYERGQLVVGFILFLLYFTWISPSIVNTFEVMGFSLILIMLALLVIYVVIHIVIRLFTKKFHFAWVALFGFVGAFYFIKFGNILDSAIGQEVYISFLSYGLFISITLIGDIFYQINKEK